MKSFGVCCLAVVASASISWSQEASQNEKYGPNAAVAFELAHRGSVEHSGELLCYPEARGIAWSETEHFVEMTSSLWTPESIVADFNRRMAQLPPAERKRGILVVLKTERCAPKWLRACTVTTAALEKRSTPLAAEFQLYGVWLKPRDNDVPAGSLKIETGADAWKNDAAGQFHFQQGPGATLAFLNPHTGATILRTDATKVDLFEKPFLAAHGQTPKLHQLLADVLRQLPETEN